MASVKKGYLTRTPSNAAFWKHLREWKRAFWKGERKAARRVANSDAAHP